MRKKNGEFPDHLILHCDVLMPFGLPFLVILGCHGLCLDVLSICTPTGGFLVVRRVLQCGRWSLHAFYSVYGEKNDRSFARGDFIFIL
jgi:hypothetical protein